MVDNRAWWTEFTVVLKSAALKIQAPIRQRGSRGFAPDTKGGNMFFAAEPEGGDDFSRHPRNAMSHGAHSRKPIVMIPLRKFLVGGASDQLVKAKPDRDDQTKGQQIAFFFIFLKTFLCPCFQIIGAPTWMCVPRRYIFLAFLKPSLFCVS